MAHNLLVTEYFQQGQALRRVGPLLEKLQGLADSWCDEEGGDAFEDAAKSAVLLYNTALLHFQTRQYRKALVILEKVFRNIEAVEDGVNFRICFLLLDLYLLFSLTEKAGYVMAFLERSMASGAGDGGGKGAPGKGEKEGGGGETEGTEDSNIKFYIHQYRARLHILSRSTKACKREIKSALNLSSQNPSALFLKSSFEYIRKNYRKSIKLLNSCPKTSDYVSGQSLAVLYYNNLGCVHLQMKKYNAATFYFTKALQANQKHLVDDAKRKGGGAVRSVLADRRHEILYNQGLVLLQVRRCVAAHECFQAAAQAMQANPLLWLRMAECCVAEHARLSEPTCGSKPSLNDSAVGRSMGSGAHRKILLRPMERKPTVKSPLTLDMAKAYLRNADLLLAGLPRTPDAATPAHIARGKADLAARGAAAGKGPGKAAKENRFAASEEGGADRDEAEGAELPTEAGLVPGTLAGRWGAGDVAAFKAQVVLNSAYVALALGDFELAHAECGRLTGDPASRGVVLYLAHLYDAEALLELGRVDKAVQHLSLDIVQRALAPSPATPAAASDKEDGTANGDGAEGDAAGVSAVALDETTAKVRHRMRFVAGAGRPRGPACGRTTTASARAPLTSCRPCFRAQPPLAPQTTMLLNLAVAYCINSDLDAAAKCLTKVGDLTEHPRLATRACLLQVYIELRRGNPRRALDVAKHHRVGAEPQ